jgi:4'-phosphopantetheinyl transferase EntD
MRRAGTGGLAARIWAVPMISDILPAGALAVESRGPARNQGLFPAEAAGIATANPGRRAEFAAGRAVARAALARLGAPAGPVLPGRAGEPRWPDGVVGSITHCAGYRACAVALTRDLAAIGIDAEPCLPLADGLLEAMTGEAERASLAGLSTACPATPWDRVLFCAKESVYKAWFPYTGERLGLRGMTIQISAAGTFAALLPCAVPPRASGATPVPDHSAAPFAGPLPARLTGRWLASRGLIVTAVCIPP